MRNLILNALLILIANSALSESIVIRNVDIYESSGVRENVSVYVVDGIIKNIDSLIFQTADIEIDATNKTLTGGLFNGETHIGAVEVGAISSTVDFHTDDIDVTASFKPSDSFNPNSTLIPHNRVHGLTHALLTPEAESHMIAGQAAIVELGNNPKVINPSVGIVIDYTEHGVSLMGNSRSSAMAKLKLAFDDARDFSRNRKAALLGDHRDYELSLADLYALEPVISGEKPVIVRVARSSDILDILEFAKDFQLKLILSGVAEGWMVADQIAKANIPVIMDPIYNLPTAYENLGARLDNAALLHKSGVQLIFTGMGWHNTHSAYLVRQSAGNAVANGLPKEAAIAAITSSPAEIFQIGYSGKIREGELANFVLWSGDPLEVTSEAELVMIAGGKIAMASRSLQLRDRYFNTIKNQLN